MNAVTKRGRGRPQRDLSDEKFGWILPLKRVTDERGVAYWKCACIGNGYACISRNVGEDRFQLVQHSQLVSGNKRSCGCMRLQRSGSKVSGLPKKEWPYCVKATVDDYNTARVSVTETMRLRMIAEENAKVLAAQAPKGEVLDYQYALMDEHGNSHPCTEEQLDSLDHLEPNSPEFWARVHEIIAENRTN